MSTVTSKRRQTARNKNKVSVAVKVKHEPQEETTDDEQADMQRDILPPIASHIHVDDEGNDVKNKINENDRRAIVYTTRLDDMEVVLRSLHVLEPLQFFDRMLGESRPQLTRKSFARKAPYVNRPRSYLQLICKIQEANKVSIGRARWLKGRANKKLKDIAVESSISREDDVTKVRKDKTPNQSIETERRIIEPIAVNTAVKDVKYYLYCCVYRDNYFILKNTKTNKADVYYLNNNRMVTQHYILNHITSLLHNIFTPTRINAHVSYCCWYEREKIILLMGRFLPVPTVTFLKNRHACNIDQCTCCCKNKTESSDEPKVYKNSPTLTCLNQSNMDRNPKTTAGIANINEEIIYVPVKTSVLIREMLMSSLAETSSFILNAFAYLPRERRRGKPRQMTNLLFLKYTNIFMNYKHRGNEFFEIGPEGEIRRHLKNVSESFIGELEVSDPNLVNKTICCWYKREMFLHSLNAMHVSPKSKYIKTSHSCPIGNCICCCNPSKKSSGKTNLRQILLPNVPSHSDNPCKLFPSLKFAFTNTEPRTLDSLAAEPIKEIPPNTTEINEVPCSSSESAAKFVPVDNSKANDLDEGEKYKFICDRAKDLLGSKVHTFRNMCVSVNNKGKITATLNISVTKLSTNELKVLSEVLTQAQKNVDTYKRRSANKKTDNIILNNSITAALSTQSCTESSLQAKIDALQKSSFYSLMSYWSYRHDQCHLSSLESLLHCQKINMSNKSGGSGKTKNKRTLAEESDDVNEERKRRRSRKLNEDYQTKAQEPLPPKRNVYRGKINKQFKDPKEAMDNDNNINNLNQLKEQSDITSSYPDVPLLKSETLGITSEMPQIYLQPWPAAILPPLVPLKPAAALPYCTNTKLGENGLPINSMFRPNDESNTQDMDDKDCILGL